MALIHFFDVTLNAYELFLNCMILQVILNDPFLGKRIEEGNFTTVPLRDEFLENARLFIFETYCRIHQRIDMGYVSEIVPSMANC